MKSMLGLQVEAHDIAKSKGWWDAYRTQKDGEIELSLDQLNSKLMLVVGELAEASECIRNRQLHTFIEGGKPEGLPVEMADAVIRLMDLAHAIGVNLEREVENKMEYNKGRAHKHGGKAI